MRINYRLSLLYSVNLLTYWFCNGIFKQAGNLCLSMANSKLLIELQLLPDVLQSSFQQSTREIVKYQTLSFPLLFLLQLPNRLFGIL